jgi:hypothetical protein
MVNQNLMLISNPLKKFLKISRGFELSIKYYVLWYPYQIIERKKFVGSY